MEVFEGGITSPKGFKAAGVHCGIKKEKLDLAVIYSEVPAKCAIAYTQNKVRAAPIEVMMKKDPKTLQALVINSGNANAITGVQGIYDSKQMVFLTAQTLGIRDTLVGVASTGVISRFLPMDKISAGIPKAVQSLGKGPESDDLAARAIMTTDTVKKEASCRVTLKDGTVATIAGITKGSGMISPAMKVLHATTLTFMVTDAHLGKNFNRRWQDMMDVSFNVISVDGDQSTNDISVFLANGMAGGKPADDDPAFWEGVRYIAQQLAKKIVIDGEGATKLIEVMVHGAKNPVQARSAARAIIASSLVKTAIFGADPNFGRILAALGNSDAEFNLEKVKLVLRSNGDSVTLFEDGAPTLVAGSDVEAAAKRVLSHKKIVIDLDLNNGYSTGEAWGCDLSYDYVKINAMYTT
ncbi:MAG TPA: bifunctional ornithine acetyltransferase/N-acetylglutamate synthase [Methanomassiliicoccales archaeon]|nr:bifunctional ornithine acetyltransferase/N-acetylglutamate synthase [Methanomassiliicoccales archaeon]HNX47855.1 bifunctional ornithine acetyltransferase/N-acetylglutamate synthase [Methanomassiliicoccales archaeon]HPR98281.1 bifunctional ornithine acetyltransferase/N-acetylglutamate synthase [Methanomassiliicoccales archaeon]